MTMTLEETLSILSRQQYPHNVDVVDRVMAAVESKPYLQPRRHNVILKRTAVVAAVAAVALLIANAAGLNLFGHNESDMGTLISQVNDYSSWNTIESAAVNPIEYLYEE